MKAGCCLPDKGLAAERGQMGTPGGRSCQEKLQELPSLSWSLPLALPAHTWVFWARRISQTLPRAAAAFSLLDHATGGSFYTWLSMLQTATPDLLEPSYPSICSQQHLVQHFLSLGQDSTYFFPQHEEKNKSDSHSKQKISKAFVIRVSHLISFVSFFKQSILSVTLLQAHHDQYSHAHTLLHGFKKHSLKKVQTARRLSPYLALI